MPQNSEQNIFRKKFLLPVAYVCMVGLGVWGATGLIPQSSTTTQAGFGSIAPAAGEETETVMPEVSIEQVDENLLKSTPPLEALSSDAQELPPIRISPDKPEVIELDRDAVNVIVGSDETLRAVPDTNRSIILIPKKPGATFFKATDADGNIIMQRHVIIGGTQNNYIRIRRACINGDDGCKSYSVYYCPDTCHEVSIVQDVKETKKDIPQGTAATSHTSTNTTSTTGSVPPTTTPTQETTE